MRLIHSSFISEGRSGAFHIIFYCVKSFGVSNFGLLLNEFREKGRKSVSVTMK